MVRRYTSDSSDDELPELDDFINTHVKSLDTLRAPKLMPTTNRTLLVPSPARTIPRRAPADSSARKQSRKAEPSAKPLTTRQPRERRIVDPEPVLPQAIARPKPLTDLTSKTCLNASKTRATPHRRAKETNVYREMVDLTADTDEEKSDIEESILCDSEEDDGFETAQEDAPNDVLSKFKKLQLEPALVLKKMQPELVSTNIDQQFETLKLRTFTPDTEFSESDGDLDSNIFNSRSPGKTPLKTYRSPRKIVIDSDSSDSDKENDRTAGEKTSYPKLERPDLRPTVNRPLTPPPVSPRKSKLVSPSKNKAPRVPTPPHRQSLDAFWDIHAVNDWNDQYSPQKPLVSPKKDRFRPLEDTSDSPISSPRKLQSPSKRSRAVIDAKREFENRKHQLAEDFLAELDRTITEGKVQELASGGVQFIWSKTLNSTAGRANWRREKMKMSDGTTDITYRHHASIELAEKVIDDEERLLNVVAHEFCHLANFMVSGIKDQPHGRQFKIWGAKCTAAFGHRGVEVTTKHSYQIDYKYIWSCSNELCGHEFKRHSKSIDPTKQTCGVCRGKLIQVKPVPRKQAAASGPVGYAAFVKQNFAGLKKDMVEASHKEIMTALGQRYREQKAAALDQGSLSTKAVGVDDLTKALGVIELD